MVRKVLMVWKVFLFVFVTMGLVGCSGETVSEKNEKQTQTALGETEKIEESLPVITGIKETAEMEEPLPVGREVKETAEVEESLPVGTEVKETVSTKDSLQKEVRWGNAPDFTLSQLNGESFTLSSLKGKVIILDFWATWCPPCIKGVPDFMDLQERYKNQGLEVVGVLLDQGKKSSLESKVKKMGINYTVVFGDREVTQLYGGVRAIPTTFIIDQKGNKIEKYVGYNSKETFENKIKELFAQ